MMPFQSQSEQGLHGFLICLHLFETLLYQRIVKFHCSFELYHEETCFAYAKTKVQMSCVVIPQLIIDECFGFHLQIEQSLYLILF